VTLSRRNRPHPPCLLSQARRRKRIASPNWKPKLGVLGSYSEANLDFVKAEGFTSMQLRIDPTKVDRGANQRDQGQDSTHWHLHISLACDGKSHRSRPGQTDAAEPVHRENASSCAASWESRISAGSPVTSKGQPLQLSQVDDILRVYTEKYFAAMREKNKVRILWVAHTRAGPNIATVR